jgi:hypothetical protein
MSAKVSQNPFRLEGIPRRLSAVSATKYIRRMRGGSQSILVQCEDGRYYIVKMTDNPQGPNVLANELLGSVLGSVAGLPVATASLVYLSDRFIDNACDLWFQTSDGVRRPQAGLHYGSQFIGETEGPNRPTEYISRSRIQTINNRGAFLGMYLLDVWANQQDHRQAMLLRSPNGHGSEAFFFDHGFMFGGPDWSFAERRRFAGHLEGSIYSGLWDQDKVAEWISHFEKVIPDALSSAVLLIPSQWYKGNVGVLKKVLLLRLQTLRSLVDSDAAVLEEITRRSMANDILRLPRDGIRMLGTSV